MNEFVEECRREWKRLRVPDPVANEMAAELAADLEEAEAEGVSPEEVLGSGAFDPCSFATAWAAERGVIQRPPPSGHELPRRLRMAAVFAAFAVSAVAGALLVILASPSAPTRLAIQSDVGSTPRAVRLQHVVRYPPGVVSLPTVPASGAAPIRAVAPPPASSTPSVAVDINDSAVDTRIVGSVLLIVGLAGVVSLTMFWLWAGPGPWSRRTHVDDRPSGTTY